MAAIDELADAFVEDEEHEAGSKADWSSSLRSVAAPSGKPAWGSSTNNNHNNSGRGSTNTVSSKRDFVVPPLAAAAALDVINPLAGAQ